MNEAVKFKVLLGIAQSDGDFDSTEKDFIRHLASLQGLSMPELKTLLQESDKMSVLVKDLSFDDKVEILIHAVRLMKIDHKVLLSEIKYCERVAKFFGFEEKAVGFLSSSIESDPNVVPNMGRIKFKMRHYLVDAN